MFATLELPLRDDSRHKRLKVGRACHPCRMKKIKCDGKQPCMQCKARRRKCMYLKNSDETYIKLDPLTDNGVSDSFFQDIAERAQEQQQRQQRLAAQAAQAAASGAPSSSNGSTTAMAEDKIFMADDRIDNLFSGGGSPPPAPQSVNQHSTSSSSNNSSNTNHGNNSNGMAAATATATNGGLLHHHHHHHPNGIERSTTPGSVSSSANNGSNNNSNKNRANTRPDKMIEQLTDGLVRLTLHHDAPHLDDGNVTPWRNYGDFVRWSPEPNLPHYYTAPIDMPTRPIQEHLIHVFFSQCHPILPTLSRSMFFDQLNVKGPLITPLLLNIMYAHAANHVQDNNIQGHVFYNRARRLVDDFLDVPRVSTVIALLYMASYTNEDQSDTRIRSSRAWMYSGMAVRMCLELGLHTTNYSSQMSQFDIELRKRVLWTCYVMDKLESCLSERPWMLRAKDIALEFPTPLPEDDVQERSVLEGFGQLCRLMILMERIIHFFAYDIKNRNNNNNSGSAATAVSSTSNGLLWTINEENQTLHLLEELGQWRDSLPEPLQWTPQHNNVPASSIVANLHLVYYDLELSLVMCCRYQDERLHRERRRTLANTITHIVSLTIQHPHLMYTFGLTAFSAIFAALTHAADFDHPIIQIAEEAKMQFRKTLEDVRAIVEHVPIRDMHNFARLVDLTLQPPQPPQQQQQQQQQTTAPTLPSIQIPSNNNSTSTANSATSRLSYANAFSAITNLVHDNNKSSNVFATTNHHQQQQQPQVSAAAAAAIVMSEAFSQGSASTALAPFSTTANLVSSAFATFDPTCMPSSSAAKTQSVSSVTGSNGSGGNGEAPKSIEPADYTFELISVADEWARTLMYQ